MSVETNTSNWQDIKARPKHVTTLYQKEMIDEGARRMGQIFLSGEPNWIKWIERLTLGLGTALILAGIIFFFAYNWADMSKWAKLGLIEVGIILGLISTAFFSLKTLPGQLSLLTSSVLVGVFMAVFGQIYQTGADPFELFAAWAVLILPWAILANFISLWLVWLVIVNIAAVLFLDQWINLTYKDALLAPTLIAVINGTALCLYEWAHTNGRSGFQSLWPRRLIAIALLFSLGQTICMWIGLSDAYKILPLSCLLIAVTIQITLFIYSRWRWPDFILLAGVIIALAIELEYLIVYKLIDGKPTATLLFLTGGITLILFTLSAIYLRRSHKIMESQHAVT